MNGALEIALALGLAAGSAQADPVKYVHIFDAHAAVAVRQAVKGAAGRLARPGCQRLLREFTDGAGRPLVVTLEERGLTPSEYIQRMRFYDGTAHPRCEKADINALTLTRGGWLVYVCPSQFRTTYERNHNLAEA